MEKDFAGYAWRGPGVEIVVSMAHRLATIDPEFSLQYFRELADVEEPACRRIAASMILGLMVAHGRAALEPSVSDLLRDQEPSVGVLAALNVVEAARLGRGQ